MQAYTADGLLGLLHEGWQLIIAVCLLVITAVGLARLVGGGPTRMTNGVFVTGFGFPVVPQGEARVRCQVSASHTRDDLEEALAAFERVGRKLRLI